MKQTITYVTLFISIQSGILLGQAPVYQPGWPKNFDGVLWDVISMVNLDQSGALEVLGSAAITTEKVYTKKLLLQ